MDLLIRHLRRAVPRQDVAGRTDGQLLASFIDQKDEAAFEALVHRHGPMVFGVCRRVAQNHHDAEDAFQATFLVLARKASSVRPRERVANWLHGVALRTAMKANATSSRRRGREKQVAELPEPAETPQDPWHGLQPLIDQELNGLPENYRLPILLCDLEGKAIKEAAQHLGWPQGTLAGRLARGRKLLASRLANRGVALSAASVAAALSQNAASAGVPASLMTSTARAATMMAAGQATAAGVVPATAAALTEGVIMSMMLAKLSKAAMAVLVMLCLGGLGVGGLLRLTTPEARGQAPVAFKTAKEGVTARQHLEQLQGTWSVVEGIGECDGRVKTITFKGNRYSFDGDAPIITGTFQLVNLAGNPKSFDLTNEGGRTAYASFRIDGDTLYYAGHNDPKARPTDFTSTPGDGRYGHVCKRLKKKEPAKPGPTEVATTYLDNLGKNQSDRSLGLFVSPDTQVVGISKGAGSDIIWRRTAKELVESEKRERQVPQTVEATHVKMVDETLAIVEVTFRNVFIKGRAIFTLTTEGGKWQIASLVMQTRHASQR
jgi:RNA polymerase sigma factor (sigma-70 family)